MPDPEVVFVKGTAGCEEVRERARRAIRALGEAQREFAESQAELDRTFGPDPRRVFAERAVYVHLLPDDVGDAPEAFDRLQVDTEKPREIAEDTDQDAFTDVASVVAEAL